MPFSMPSTARVVGGIVRLEGVVSKENRRVATGLGHGHIGQHSASTGDGEKGGRKPKIVIYKNESGRIVGSALANKFGSGEEK